MAIINRSLLKFAGISSLIILFSLTPGGAQELTRSNETERGIQLVAEGRNEEAIDVLKRAAIANPDDADALHYLGAAYFNLKMNFNAATTFYRATRKRPYYAPTHSYLALLHLTSDQLDAAQTEAKVTLAFDRDNALAHYVLGTVQLRRGKPLAAMAEADIAVSLDRDLAEPHLLAFQAALALALETSFGVSTSDEQRDLYFQQAIPELETFVARTRDPADQSFWRRQVEPVRKFYELVRGRRGGSGAGPFLSGELTQRATFTSKPAPAYSEESRTAMECGTIKLQAVLSSDGSINNIIVTRSLSAAMNQAAIDALRKAEFTPAMINGKPVSQFMTFEYIFNLY